MTERKLSRREFLTGGVLTAANLFLASCVSAIEQQQPLEATETPTRYFSTSTPKSIGEQIWPASPTSEPILQETPTSLPTLAPSPTLKVEVAPSETRVPSPTAQETSVSLAEVIKEGDFIYTVQSGDSLSEIAEKYGISLDSLIQANPHLENVNLLSVGQAVIIPGQEGLVNAIGGSEEPTPIPIVEMPTSELLTPTMTVEPTSIQAVETPTLDPDKPYLNQPLEYFEGLKTGQIPLGSEAGSSFPGFKQITFNIWDGQYGWEKDNDYLIRFAIFAFDSNKSLITVIAEGESSARNFSMQLPIVCSRNPQDRPHCPAFPSLKYDVVVEYDDQWIPLGCRIGVWD